MYIVALAALGTTVEEEAPALAADLGRLPYETTLLLRTPAPVVLLRTGDRAHASTLLATLRARGHDAVACDARAVASSDAMTHVRSFRVELDGLTVKGGHGESLHVPWSEGVALVRAIHRTTREHVVETVSRTFDVGRAALSGGLVSTKKLVTSATHASEAREQVLYLFREREPPLLFSNGYTRYEGLGAALKPSQIENFATLTRTIRGRALHAAYDERLLTPRPASVRVRTGITGATTTSSVDAVDLLAHLVAMIVSRVGC